MKALRAEGKQVKIYKEMIVDIHGPEAEDEWEA